MRNETIETECPWAFCFGRRVHLTKLFWSLAITFISNWRLALGTLQFLYIFNTKTYWTYWISIIILCLFALPLHLVMLVPMRCAYLAVISAVMILEFPPGSPPESTWAPRFSRSWWNVMDTYRVHLSVVKEANLPWKKHNVDGKIHLSTYIDIICTWIGIPL